MASIGTAMAAARRSTATPASPLAERLQWVLDNRPEFGSGRALSDAAGLGASYVNLVLSGKRGTNGIELETAEKLAKAARVDLSWLMTGRGRPDQEPTPVPISTLTSGPRLNTRAVQAIALVGPRLHARAKDALVAAIEAGEHQDWSVDQWLEHARELHERAKKVDEEWGNES